MLEGFLKEETKFLRHAREYGLKVYWFDPFCTGYSFSILPFSPSDARKTRTGRRLACARKRPNPMQYGTVSTFNDGLFLHESSFPSFLQCVDLSTDIQVLASGTTYLGIPGLLNLSLNSPEACSTVALLIQTT